MLLKKALLITYHFPPSSASGAFRMLGFARHLPTFGWQPLVVAPPSLPWEPIDPLLAQSLPEDVVVEPVPYPASVPRLLRMLAQNALWLPRAWSACRRLIREHRPDVILTSGPPHCVHALGHYLKRWSGLPWVADFRDPWISDGKAKRLRWSERYELRWERGVFANADLILANAPNACALFQEEYPSQGDKVVVLTNGFDPRGSNPRERGDAQVMRMLHAGEIYAGRDPLPLFEALARLNAESGSRYQLEIMGRCESGDVALPDLLRQRGWDDFVALQGQRTYQETLDAMDAADILVLFDSPGRTIGVPAKLYEYFGAGRPILALAEPDGDVAAILRASGVLHRIASPRNRGEIERMLRELTQAIQASNDGANPAALQRFTRANIARTLAMRFDTLIGQPTTPMEAEMQEVRV